MAEQWILDNDVILSETFLATLIAIVEEESALIVEHRYYRGARAPARTVCETRAQLESCVNDASPGDSFWFWRFDAVCRDDNVMSSRKKPDSLGRVPIGGPY